MQTFDKQDTSKRKKIKADRASKIHRRAVMSVKKVDFLPILLTQQS